jgi:hypothetical protein
LETVVAQNSLTYFAFDQVEEESNVHKFILVTGILSVVLGLFAILLLARFIALKRSKNVKSVPFFAESGSVVPVNKRLLLGTYQMHTNQAENALLLKKSGLVVDGNEYAEPDIDNAVKPLPSSVCYGYHPSMHYASRDITGACHEVSPGTSSSR